LEPFTKCWHTRILVNQPSDRAGRTVSKPTPLSKKNGSVSKKF